MEYKIRGIEHELAMNTRPPLPHGSLIHLVGMALEELRMAGLVTSIRVEEPSLDFLAYNGSRVYNDMSHLEISSPSYVSPLEAVVYDRVTELFAYYAARGLRTYFKDLSIYKNNVSCIDSDEGWRAVSYSTHSSVLMDRKVCNLQVWDRLERELVPFMVARLPLIGGGDYVPCRMDGSLPSPSKTMRGEKIKYVISPRAAFVKRISSNDTVDARGLLNQRDDPHSDPVRYWRFHDINLEALRSPTQVYLRDGLITLVMSAYERGYYRNPPSLKDPIKAIKEMTLDTEHCNWKVTLHDGREVDAIEDIMNGFYLAGVEKMLDDTGSSVEDRMAFNLIEGFLQVLSERRLESLIHGLDWTTKKFLIEEHASSREEGLNLCNQFTLIDDEVLGYLGEYTKEERKETTFNLKESIDFAKDAIPVVNWIETPSLIRRALKNGPEASRDYLRCLVAREFPSLIESIEWEAIHFHNATISLQEPLRFNRAYCGDELESATGTFSEFMQSLNRLNLDERHVTYKPVDDHEKEE